jgi:hypothetical protein
VKDVKGLMRVSLFPRKTMSGLQRKMLCGGPAVPSPFHIAEQHFNAFSHVLTVERYYE